MEKNKISVELTFQQLVLSLQVSPSCTAEEAILQSGILKQCPDIDLTKNKIGIFGKKISLSTLLHEGDRIEIYRPLLIDPKTARKLRSRL